jgi:hypothetical protein
MNPHVSLVGLIRIRIWNGSGMFIPDPDFCPKSNKRGVEKKFSAFFVATNITKLCDFELMKKKFGLIYKELTFYLKNFH